MKVLGSRLTFQMCHGTMDKIPTNLMLTTRRRTRQTTSATHWDARPAVRNIMRVMLSATTVTM